MTLEIEEKKKWLRTLDRRGWIVIRNTGDGLVIRCKVQDCRHQRHVEPGDTPEACQWDHSGRFQRIGVERYEELADILTARRQRLGLSQMEISSAAGLADGHINKLETDVRNARLPTLLIWAAALGLRIELVPDSLPASTASILCDRVGRPSPRSGATSRRAERKAKRRQLGAALSPSGTE